MRYDASRPEAFFDSLGEREWIRFEDGRSSPVSLEVHRHYLRRFVARGDHVLEVGAGPGRFTIELAQLGASIVVTDLSTVQLELNRTKVDEAGVENAVERRMVADVTELSGFADEEFDATVCYGGPLSYALDRADQGVGELVRVTRAGGYILASVMSLVGAFSEELRAVLALPVEINESIVATGYLDTHAGGHVEMRLFRWPEIERLFADQGCTIVAASASNLNTHVEQELFATLDESTREALIRWEVDLCAEPGAVSSGPHIIVVARRDE
jgi:ubiquinone/menaquinone biosynthesis C-methylase UbiE